VNLEPALSDLVGGAQAELNRAGALIAEQQRLVEDDLA
jgi:hypothetical protein